MTCASAGKAQTVIPIISGGRAEEDRFVLLYNRQYKRVYNYVCFRINNHYDAEDLVSTVFLNVIRRFNTYNPEKGPEEAWIMGIAKNVVFDYLRNRKNNSFAPADELLRVVSPNRQPDQVVVINEEYYALMKAVSKLREKDRQVIAMKFVTELKNVEIAGILGVSESNVGVCLHRALKRLRKIAEKEGGFFV